MNLIIKNVILVENNTEKSADLFIEGGIIVDIRECGSSNYDFIDKVKVIDGKGSYALPGLIDMNCETCEPGFDYKEDMVTVSKSGLRSGFTSLTSSPNTNPVVDNKLVVKYINVIGQDQALVNIFPYGQMSKGGLGTEISEIGEMYDSGIVGISDGNISISDDFLLMNIFSYSKLFNIPVITFCENKSLKGSGVVNKGICSMITGLKGITSLAEETYVSRNILLASEHNSRVHITKVSTKGSVELIRLAKSNGVNITCDTTPHYIYLTEEEVFNYNTYFKVNPPLRTREDNEAIIEGLKDGTIDVISTGHSPENIESKKREFEVASDGVSSLETAFNVCYTALVDTGRLTLTELMDKFTTNPYNILNIKNKGKIEKGYDADIFLFDKSEVVTVYENDFESKAKYSMFNGREFQGTVTHTIVGGNLVYKKAKNII